jgi:hypothetical protein
MPINHNTNYSMSCKHNIVFLNLDIIRSLLQAMLRFTIIHKYLLLHKRKIWGHLIQVLGMQIDSIDKIKRFPDYLHTSRAMYNHNLKHSI